MGRYDHIDFTPPKGAREAARRALDVRETKPPSERGMTPVGIARARDLINGETLSPETVRRMLAFFTRHEVDKQGSTWGEKGKGWQAWNGWGGDAGFAWARKVVAQMEAADKRAASETMTEHTENTEPVDDTTAATEAHAHGACVPLRMAEGDDSEKPVSVIQVAKAGRFEGHPAGAFEMTAETFRTIAANFARSENRRIPIDYEHATEMIGHGATLQSGAPAVGWITALSAAGDKLFATVEWVDAEAVAHIRAGRYRFCSPAVVLDAIDGVTGERIGPKLTSVGLTNRPFLDGMEPLAARDASEPFTASLSPESVHIPAAIEAATRSEMDEEMMAAEKLAADKEKASYGKLMRRMASAMGFEMSDDAEADESAMIAKLEALVGEMKAAQAAEIAAMCDRVIASGRVDATKRDTLVKLCSAQREVFVDLYPEATQTAPAPKSTEPQGATDDARVMSASIAPQGGTAPASKINEPVVQMSHSDAADARAKVLMSQSPSLTYAAALTQASREIKSAAVESILSRINA
jgi:phage I-like protein